VLNVYGDGECFFQSVFLLFKVVSMYMYNKVRCRVFYRNW